MIPSWPWSLDDKDKRIRKLEKELEYQKQRYASTVEAMEFQYKKLTAMYLILRQELDGIKSEQGVLSIVCKTCGAKTSGWCYNCLRATLH